MQGGASIECKATNYNDERLGTMSYYDWAYIAEDYCEGMAPTVSTDE